MSMAVIIESIKAPTQVLIGTSFDIKITAKQTVDDWLETDQFEIRIYQNGSYIGSTPVTLPDGRSIETVYTIKTWSTNPNTILVKIVKPRAIVADPLPRVRSEQEMASREFHVGLYTQDTSHPTLPIDPAVVGQQDPNRPGQVITARQGLANPQVVDITGTRDLTPYDYKWMIVLAVVGAIAYVIYTAKEELWSLLRRNT
jgi:hypothetical protein